MKSELVFLCDLTHTGKIIATDSFPLNIGYISSYAKRVFGSSVRFRLFKYPEKLLEALKEETPSVVGFANYVWNDNINRFFCDRIKASNPDMLIVAGGPNFPLATKDQAKFLNLRKNIDFFAFREGEIGFSNLIERFLDVGPVKVKEEVINGLVRLDGKDKVLAGKDVSRLVKLDEIESPYLNGSLDEFFDGKLIPMLETTRGCPFSCNFCNSGESYYTKVRSFSLDRVKEEIHYMGKRCKENGMTFMLITDMNFGMFPRDRTIAEEIKKCQDVYNWPLSIYIETGKNKVENVGSALEVLKDNIYIKISIQSNTDEVLKEIRRQNISTEVYRTLCEKFKKEGRGTVAELIAPLPKETFKSYMDSIKYLVDSNVDQVTNYTLQMNYGTVYKDPFYKRKYDYQTFFRPYANCFGIYDGDIVTEAEEVGVATDTLSIEEYVDIREYSFLIEIIYNSGLFVEVFDILREYSVDASTFLEHLFKRLKAEDCAVRKSFQAFRDETLAELFESEEHVFSFFKNKGRYDDLIQGKIGRNVIFSHTSIIFSEYRSQFIEFIHSCMQDCLKSEDNELVEFEIAAVIKYISLKLDGILNKTAEPVVFDDFDYNISLWSAQDEEGLRHFQDEKMPIYFYFSAKQIDERKDNFKRYGTDPAGCAKIISQLGLQKMYRHITTLPSEIYYWSHERMNKPASIYNMKVNL